LPETDGLQIRPTPPERGTDLQSVLPETDGLQIRPTPPEPSEAKPPAPAPRLPEVKLRLECPDCGTAGLFDVRNLDRKFRSPGCPPWRRTDDAGVPVRAEPGSESAAPTRKSRAPAATPALARPVEKPAEKPLTPEELWGPPPGKLPVPSPAVTAPRTEKKKKP